MATENLTGMSGQIPYQVELAKSFNQNNRSSFVKRQLSCPIVLPQIEI